jgi:hypothetical protein
MTRYGDRHASTWHRRGMAPSMVTTCAGPSSPGFAEATGLGTANAGSQVSLDFYHDMGAYRTTVTTFASPCVCRRCAEDVHPRTSTITRTLHPLIDPWWLTTQRGARHHRQG